MNKVAILQARMGSTRLPGKSLLPLVEEPLVRRVVQRVMKAAMVDHVVVAIPEEPRREELQAAVDDLVRVIVVPGNPNDLIHRYNVAADLTDAELIIRVPCDNPCVEPEEINRIVLMAETCLWQDRPFLVSNLDQNIEGNGYPGGLGAEVYTRKFLRYLDAHCQSPAYREHPHKWAFDMRRVVTVMAPSEICYPYLRFDVNTQEDYEYIRAIYEATFPHVCIHNTISHLMAMMTV